MIRVENLHKSYPCRSWLNSKPARRALYGLNFEIANGSTTVVLGLNGAGKSTLLSILAGQIDRFEGHVQVHGCPMPASTRKHPIGYATEQPLFPSFWTVEQLLEFTGHVQGLGSKERSAKKAELCDAFGLSPLLENTIGRLSKGMKQRVNLAQSLMTQSALIVWDEPTSGLDWSFSSFVQQQIHQLRDRGKTLLISTHDLKLAASVSDQILYIHEGALKHVGDFTSWKLYLQEAQSTFEQQRSQSTHENPPLLP